MFNIDYIKESDNKFYFDFSRGFYKYIGMEKDYKAELNYFLELFAKQKNIVHKSTYILIWSIDYVYSIDNDLQFKMFFDEDYFSIEFYVEDSTKLEQVANYIKNLLLKSI